MTDKTHNELTLEQLSTRREKQGLSTAEMANRIKVSREIIHYIEQGEFNCIGSATFIRGHVGNYARELDLDPQSVLSLVPAQHLKPYEPNLSANKVTNPLSRVKTQSSGFGRYVLGTFLVAALGLSFYFVYDKWDSQAVDFEVQTAEENNQSPDIKPNKKKVIYSSLLPQADLADEEEAKNSNRPQTDDTNNESGIMTENFDGDDNAQTPPSPNYDSTDQTTDNPEDESVSDDEGQLQQTVSTESQTVSEAPQYNIHFDLSEQAWVSIKTQNGTIIVSDLIGPGERQFSADEPLNFRLGNASQLRLKINNQSIDLRDKTRQNVAVFEWPFQNESVD